MNVQNFKTFCALAGRALGDKHGRERLRKRAAGVEGQHLPGARAAQDFMGGATSSVSSRQWDPGWEASVAEQEVLPHTVLDELQLGGKTTITKDEAAWLDTELNATFCGHPDFAEANGEEMRAVVRRSQIVNLHCKELLEYYGFIEPASKNCRHASNVVVDAGKKDRETARRQGQVQDNAGCNQSAPSDHHIQMVTEEGKDKTAFWWGN
ncbi:hypothetical protein CYMTET_28612 [Cymbomonas tetramitiformis]|uniref:Uncharacterized protein n=1 Tax=Cymbomonas tetramitiformis TaxID=36881 RepID=A0AAE0KVQ5_9CHLO|nr:hypothetical protein CYMTET_28612 [Cymbomonas tetramitiformis]